jgi:adenosylcobinamide-phosphate synthase
MSNRKVIAAAYLFDWMAGDPEWFPHPVRLVGKAVEEGERTLRRCGQTPAAEFGVGGVLTFAVVIGTYFGTAKTIAWMHRRGRILGFVAENVACVDMSGVAQSP